jgi:hypothetical protein
MDPTKVYAMGALSQTARAQGTVTDSFHLLFAEVHLEFTSIRTDWINAGHRHVGGAQTVLALWTELLVANLPRMTALGKTFWRRELLELAGSCPSR